MSALTSLLAAITGGGAPQPPTSLAPPAAAPQQDPNEVQALTVTAAKKDSAPQHDQPVEFNYNNNQAAQAVNNAVSGAGPVRGGSANPGIYGLLPEHLQHGTLRNVLGAIGDAFLVGSGHEAQYRPRMERQEIGQALAGYNPDDPASVQAAIQRVASTGAAGSTEMADQLQKNYGASQDRKAQMEQTTQYHNDQIENRRNTTLSVMAPRIEGLMHGVTDPTDYARKYAIADGIAKRVDPEADATSAFGLVAPEEWQPGMESGYGMTTNQKVVSEDKDKQRQTSERNTDVNAHSRVQSAQINAGGHVEAAKVSGGKATDAVILQGLVNKQNSGQQLTPAEQTTFDHLTGVKTHRALPPGILGNKAPPKFENGKVYKDAHGNRARYVNGKWVPA